MKAQRYNAYDVQVASKTDPAARYVLASEYAKLEAENATATHQIESLANQCQFQAERLVALEAEANDHCRASLAANATLDRLRDVVPEDFSCNWCDKCNKFVNLVSEQDYEDIWTRCENCGSIMYDQSTDAAEFLRAILYPTPENDND